MSPDERAAAVFATAAALVCAVADEDPAEVASVLAGVTDWPALAVVLAGNVDDRQPLGLQIRSLSDEATGLRIIDATAAATGIGSHLILSDRRDRIITDARAIAMYACHHAGLTYSAIGRLFGRDHTTAMYAVTRIGENQRLRALANQVITHAGITRPADDTDQPEHQRTNRCACGARTRNPDGICRKCQDVAA